VRERQALAYYVACSADLFEPAGHFVVEASTAPQQVAPFISALAPLLSQHAERIDADELQRARNQAQVRRVRQAESLVRVMEDAAMDLFVRGRLHSDAQRAEALDAVSAEDIRQRFAAIAQGPAAVALVGPVTRRISDEATKLIGPAVQPSGHADKPA
jgi:predicted Zn-dependent peptidase